MAHVLDNPVWHALISGNKNLAEGSAQAKYFAGDVSPFAGFEAATPQAFSALHALVPAERMVGVVSPVALDIPPQWRVERALPVLQMVQEMPAEGDLAELKLTPLGPAHIPAMLALTQQTNPGPFLNNTIAFGHYQGIFVGEQLAAMAGQRMNPTPYAEISAVCTHPDHLGRGYAAALIRYQGQRIIAASGIPFLHVKSDNVRAISLYQRLGFVPRHEMHFYIIQKSPV